MKQSRRIGIIDPIPPELLKIAKSVRKWCLKEGGGYTEGMCFDASNEIERKLKKARFIDGWFYCSFGHEHHCWVEIGDYILDVTADQFNYTDSPPYMGAIVYGKKSKLKMYKKSKE